MLRLKVTPVVGLPQFTGWSQVAESTVSVGARLILVYAISGKHAGNVGRDISEKVSDFYFYDAEQLHDFLRQLVNYAHSNDCKIYFSGAVLGREKSIFATYGGSVFLKRVDKSGKILASDYEVKIVEGNYLDEDVFVLTTLQADQFLSEIQLKFQQGYDVDIIITSVVPGLHAQEDSSLSAIVFISKDDEANEENNDNVGENSPFFEVADEDESESLQDIPLSNENVNSANVNLANVDSTKVNLAKVKSANVNSDQASLAEFSVEADKIVVPGFVTKFGKMSKSLTTEVIRKFLLFLKWLFRIIGRFFSWLWLKIKGIDITQIRENITLFKGGRIRAVFAKKTIYMSESKPKKGIFKIFLVVLGILLIIGIVGYFSYTRAKENDRVQKLVEPIQAQVLNAKQNADKDPIAVREVVTASIESLSVLERENETSGAVKIIQQEKQSLSDYLDSISGKEELQELDVFYDLRLAKSDFIATGIDLRDNHVIVYDKEMQQVLLLDYDSKKVSIRDFASRANFTGAVIQDEEIFVLTDGVYKYKVNFDEETELSEVREAGDSNASASLIEAYDRFVYVVNPEKRNIYRYAQTDDGYSEPVGWIKSATGIQYENLRSMSVDGDVWLTSSDGKIRKLTSGREETLTLRGLVVPFEKDIYSYTHEDLENIYVLDPSNNRIVIMAKNGDFIKEFKSVSLGASNGLAVSESLGKILITSGSIIYQINL